MPYGGVLQCPIVPPFTSVRDRVRRARHENVASQTNPTQIPKPIPGWLREPECFTVRRRSSVAQKRYLVPHPKWWAKLKADLAEKEKKSKNKDCAIESPGEDIPSDIPYMDTPVPGFFSNQELVNLNLPERILLLK